MAHALVNGVNLYYRVEGNGPPLLLIAGMGSHSGSWSEILPLLKKQFQCIVLDNRGVGRSDAPPGPYSIDQMADDVAGLLNHLQLGRISAVGHSMGGSVLQSLAIRSGHLLDRIILMNALPAYTAVQQLWLENFLAIIGADLSAEARAMVNLAWIFTPRLLSDHITLRSYVALMCTDRYPLTYEALRAQSTGLRQYDSRPGLPRVRNACLVLSGAEDILTPPAQSIEIANLLPRARLQFLPRGGHAMMIEYAADTAAAITAFLRLSESDLPGPEFDSIP